MMAVPMVDVKVVRKALPTALEWAVLMALQLAVRLAAPKVLYWAAPKGHRRVSLMADPMECS
jgi:hypothetical protein